MSTESIPPSFGRATVANKVVQLVRRLCKNLLIPISLSSPIGRDAKVCSNISAWMIKKSRRSTSRCPTESSRSKMQEKQSPKVGTGMIIQPFTNKNRGSAWVFLIPGRRKPFPSERGRWSDSGCRYSSASDVLSGSDLTVGAFFWLRFKDELW